MATRLIMMKADGCVAIHADGGAYKPLNWMNAPNKLVDEGMVLTVTNPKGEQLIITLEEIISDVAHELGVDPGLQKDGVEAHLQELLAAAPGSIEDDLILVRREYPTDIGPVDLLCRDASGQVVAIEVKRRGEIDGVDWSENQSALRIGGRLYSEYRSKSGESFLIVTAADRSVTTILLPEEY